MALTIPGEVTANPAQTANNAISTSIARMAASGNPQAAQLAAQLSQQYGVTTGQGGGSSLSLPQQVEKAASVVGNYAGPVLNLLNRPSQGVLHALNAYSGQGMNILNPMTTVNAIEQGAQGLLGTAPNIDLRQAMNFPANAAPSWDPGGDITGLVDTVGSAALDPTTYFGGPAIKAGLKGVKALAAHAAETDAGKAALTQAAPALSRIAEATTPIKNALVPGAELNSAVGPEAGNAILDATQQTEQHASQQTADTFNQLSALVKDSGLTTDELTNVITPAIENGTAANLAASFANSGDTAKANLVTQINDILAPSAEAAGKAITPITKDVPAAEFTVQGQPSLFGAEPNQELLPQSSNFKGAHIDYSGPEATKTAIPFELTKQGLKAYSKNPTALADALGIGVKDLNKAVDSGVAPQLAGSTSLADTEAKLQATGLVKQGQTFLNHNIVDLAGNQAQKQYQKQAEDGLVKALAGKTDEAGQALSTDDASVANKLGYVGKELSDGSKVFIHPAVAKAMQDVATVVNDDKTITAFDGMLKKATRLWKGYAVLRPGFHTQNVFGNMFMNAVAGLRSPADFKYYAQAAKIQKAMATASHSGEDFSTALSKIKGLSAKDIDLINKARAEHIADTSYFSSNQSIRKPIEAKGGAVQKLKNAAAAANPFDVNNVALKGSRALGQAFEHNSRLAHFAYQLDHGATADEARQSVNKYLFDYNDLTPFERKRIQAVVPFYTYMRKDIPAIMKLTLEHPGFFANYGKLQNNLQQNGPDNGTQYNPSELANGAFPIQLPGMSSPVLAQPQSPFYYAGAGPTQALTALASMIPGSPTHGQVAQAGQTAAQNLLSPVGGFAGGLAKFAADEATGVNVGNGAKIKPGTNGTLLAETVMPTTSLVNNTIHAAATNNDASLLRNLTGAPVYQGGSNANNATLQGRLAIVQAALAQLQAQVGKNNLPTVSALRKSGRIPRTPSAHKRRAPSHRVRRKRL